MVSRIYNVYDSDGNLDCYKGFDRQIADATLIALVLYEDTYEIYALDEGEESKKELTRYLTNGDYYSTFKVAYYVKDNQK